jgi:hypothetical protein
MCAVVLFTSKYIFKYMYLHIYVLSITEQLLSMVCSCVWKNSFCSLNFLQLDVLVCMKWWKCFVYFCQRVFMLRFYCKGGCGGYFWQLPDFFFCINRSFFYTVYINYNGKLLFWASCIYFNNCDQNGSIIFLEVVVYNVLLKGFFVFVWFIKKW